MSCASAAATLAEVVVAVAGTAAIGSTIEKIDGNAVFRNSKPPAIAMPGTASRNENRALATRVSPSARAMVIVTPEREMPDHAVFVSYARDDLAKALTDPGVNQRLIGLGRFNRPMSPAEVTAFIQGEQRTWKPILEQTGSN